MAAFAASAHWNADLKVFYRRLVANGKAHTAAIVACLVWAFLRRPDERRFLAVLATAYRGPRDR